MRMVSFYDIVQTLLEMINVILLVFSVAMMMFATKASWKLTRRITYPEANLQRLNLARRFSSYE